MRLNRKNIYEINIWPGFVDILGTLLIVTIFTVLISTITQIYFNDQLQIKRGEISSLDEEIKKLLNEIDIVSNKKIELEKKNKNLQKKVSTTEKLNKDLTEKNKEIDQLKTKSDYLLKMKTQE